MKAVKFFARVLGLPFVLGVVIIHFAIQTVIFGYNFLRYGGETIVYTRLNNSATVMEVHDYIRQYIEEQKTKEK